MSLQVEMISRRGCHLCDEMKELLVRLQEGQPFSFAVTDVDSRPGLFLYYSHRVPVLLVNGRPVAELRWDEQVVRAQLFGLTSTPASR
jgi:hypothetical protein